VVKVYKLLILNVNYNFGYIYSIIFSFISYNYFNDDTIKI